MKLQDALDNILSAAHSYHEAMSRWNGDNDGPAERAEEKLELEIVRVLNALQNNASNHG